MFEEYFKLKEQPFGASPDPRFLFRTSSHREALASLYTGYYSNRCFTVLIADPGMGKTTLLFDFLGKIRDRARTAFLFNTLCDPNDILSFILYDLGVTPAPSKVERHRQLDEILAAEARAGRRVVVVIDEAQNLSNRTLEAVRLLTNFETSSSKLLHVVLAGQPELADKLAAAEAAQLFQRVSTLCHLTPFTPADISAYIAHRLKVAGYAGSSLFTAGAIHRLAVESRGIPRIINTLCFNSLCLCQARKAKQVDRAMVAEAIADLQLPKGGQSARAPQSDADQFPGTPVLNGHEIFASISKPAQYIALAAVAICAVLGGIVAWQARGFQHSASAPSPTVSAGSPTGHGSTLSESIDVRKTGRTTAIQNARWVSPSPATEYPATQATNVTIAPGDTLAGIAAAHLGGFDRTVLRQIQTLNPRITDPDHIESGSTIRLPERDTESSIASTRLQP
jgi:type II secretory pathway predicted ATPase ExeA